MVTISKKTEYAIMLLLYLADFEGQYISLTKACKKLSVSYSFVSQLAAEMKKGKILLAREGRGGGYSLCKDWKEINLYQLIKILGENKTLVECLCEGGSCGRESKCKLKKLWARLEKVFKDEIRGVKLGEIRI